MRFWWVAIGLALVMALSGCTSDGESEPNTPTQPSEPTAPSESGVATINYTLLVDYSGWPGQQNVEATVGIPADERPSERVLEDYNREHPGNTTALDVLVAWAGETGTSLQWEDGAPVVRAIDGVGNPVDPRVPPWWCYRLNGDSPDVSSWQNPVADGDEVEFFYGDCGEI